MLYSDVPAVLQALHVPGSSAGNSGAAISGDRKHAWFIGLAPIDQTRYAIAVLLEDASKATDVEDIDRAVLEELIAQNEQ